MHAQNVRDISRPRNSMRRPLTEVMDEVGCVCFGPSFFPSYLGGLLRSTFRRLKLLFSHLFMSIMELSLHRVISKLGQKILPVEAVDMLFGEPAASSSPWNALDGEELCKGDAAGNNAGSEFARSPTLADVPGPCRKLYRMDGTRICPFCGKTFWSSASLSTMPWKGWPTRNRR